MQVSLVKICVLLYVVNNCATTSISDSNRTLELVHVIFRHGSRINDKTEVYPNDPYTSADFYPLTHGQLTNHGKWQAFQLGKLLRRRYQTFLEGDVLSSDLVWTESSAFTRTQMSALLVLAGLFPPRPEEKWNDELNWTPIPFYFRKAEHDFVIRHPMECPAYLKERKELLRSKEVSTFLESQSETFAYIREHSGMEINGLKDIFRLHQVLDSEYTRNLTLPSWTNAVFPDTIKFLATQKLLYDHSTTLLKRLYSGRLLKIILNQMLQKSKNLQVPSDRKMFLYSGHDNNVFGTLVTLGLKPDKFPDYCSAVLIELHKDKATNGSFVKVFHLKNVQSQPEEKFIPSCNGTCTLEDFSELLKPNLPGNYTQECESPVLLE